MTQKNPPAFSNGVDSLVLVNLLVGGYSRYFCLQLPAQPFLHKAAKEMCLAVPNWCKPSFFTHHETQSIDMTLLLLSLVCHGVESWNQEGL